MKQTVNSYQFHDAFKRMDRGDAFSYEGLEILFNGLEEYEEETGEELELDVIALCCEFSEMSINEIIDAYGYMMDETRLTEAEAISEADTVDYVTDWLNNQTWVLGSTDSNTIVFRQF
jgi:hypothetical protein